MPGKHVLEVRQLASLSFAKRGRALALLARGWAQITADSVLDALDQGNPDDRRTVLDLARARRDVPRIEAALRDPALRHAALSAARRISVSDTVLAEIALGSSLKDAKSAIAIIQRSQRVTLANRLVSGVITKHGPEAARGLLLTCDLEILKQHASEHDVAWRMLDIRAPRVALRLAIASGRALSSYKCEWFCRRCPEEALVLLVRPDALSSTAIRYLLIRPAELLAVLRRNDWTVGMDGGPFPPEVCLTLQSLSPADLLELRARCQVVGYHYSYDDPFFHLLPPSDQERITTEFVTTVAQSNWSSSRPPHDLEQRLRALPADIARRIVVKALALPVVDPTVRSARLRALRRFVDLSQVRVEHQSLGPVKDRKERAERMLALVTALRWTQDPATCAAVLLEVEPAWHDAQRAPVLAEFAAIPTRRVSAIPVQVYRDAALTATQSRDSSQGALGSAETAVRRAIASAVIHDDVPRVAELVEILVQIRLDPRIRWGLAQDPAPGKEKPTESLPRSLELAPEIALKVKAAYRPVRVEGTTPMLGPVAVSRFDPDGERHILELLLGKKLPPPVVVKKVTYEGAIEEVMGSVKAIALKHTDLLDGLLDREDLTNPHTVDLIAAVPPTAPGRWTPEQRRRWASHLVRVATDAGLDPAKRAKALRRINDPQRLLSLLEGTTGPVAAAILTRCARISEPSDELLALFLERAQRSGVVGRAAMSALNMLIDRGSESLALGPYRTLLLSRDCAVVNRKAAAVRVAQLVSEEARELLLAAWQSETLHPDMRHEILVGLMRHVDRPGITSLLVAGIPPLSSAHSLMLMTDHLLFPGESTVRPSVAKAHVALAEFFVDSTNEHLARAALEICVRKYSLCSQGLALALRYLSDPRTGTRGIEAITSALVTLPVEAGFPVWSAALESLVAAGAEGNQWALLRLAKLAPPNSALGGPAQTRLWRLTLAMAQRNVGLGLTAAESLKRILEADLNEGRVDTEVWATYLAVVDEQPSRWSPFPWTFKITNVPASGQVVDLLVHHGGASAALTAAELLLLAQDQHSKEDPLWAPRWAAVGALHPDAAERLMVGGRS